MPQTKTSLEYQLLQLEKKLISTKEKLPNGKYNPAYFALKGKIKNVKAKISSANLNEFLSR
jgi:hypothetical protein